MTRLHGRLLKVSKAGQGAAKPGAKDAPREGDVGANLFIGNLDPGVDEKALYDLFSAFGHIPQVRGGRERQPRAPRARGCSSSLTPLASLPRAAAARAARRGHGRVARLRLRLL